MGCLPGQGDELLGERIEGVFVDARGERARRFEAAHRRRLDNKRHRSKVKDQRKNPSPKDY